jgi:DNA-binding NarL/FixJ family response regulator
MAHSPTRAVLPRGRVHAAPARSNLTESHPGRRLSVCLVAFHPLVLAEFERRLAQGPFRVMSRRFDISGSGDLEPMTIPAASVYVLEANAVSATTEAAIAMLQPDGHRMRLVAVAERLDQPSSFLLLRCGAKGLLDFEDTIDQLPTAVEVVARGGFWVPRTILSRFVEEELKSARRRTVEPAKGRLSAREREVCDLLLENLSNRDIAERLVMSERTVKFHVSNLLSKFGVKRRADLIVLAHADDEVEPASD